MNKKKIVVLILVIMFAMLIGFPLAFARGGGGGHGGGHASGHAGGEGGHESTSAHGEESAGSHSEVARTRIVPRTYFVGSGGHGTLQDLCPKGVEHTEDQGASDVSVTCNEDKTSAASVGVILGFFAIVFVIVAPLFTD